MGAFGHAGEMQVFANAFVECPLKYGEYVKPRLPAAVVRTGPTFCSRREFRQLS